MSATGLTKGGIYGNFSSKDEIAVAAFEYNVEKVLSTMRAMIRAQKEAVGKLHAILEYFLNYYSNPNVPVKGGCPLLNTAVESDDTHPELKLKVSQTFDLLQSSVVKIIRKGVEMKQLRNDANAEAVADLIISALEGSLMITRVQQNPRAAHNVIGQLKTVIKNELL